MAGDNWDYKEWSKVYEEDKDRALAYLQEKDEVYRTKLLEKTDEQLTAYDTKMEGKEAKHKNALDGMKQQTFLIDLQHRQVREAEHRFNDYQGTVYGMRDEVAKIKSDISDALAFKAAIVAVNQEAEHKKELHDLTTEKDGVIQTLQNELAGKDGDIRTLRTKVRTLEEEKTELAGQKTALEGHVDVLESELETVREEKDALENDLNNLRNTLLGLSRNHQS